MILDKTVASKLRSREFWRYEAERSFTGTGLRRACMGLQICKRAREGK